MKTLMTEFAILIALTVGAAPLGSEFTYQGVLSDAGAPASGDFDFRCILYDAGFGGSQVGVVVFIEDLTATEGRFTTQLDFGSIFDGTALWLEVGVRDGGSTGAYTVLSPRQELTAAPFAQHAQTADTATTAGHATTAGDADTLDSQHGAYYLTWSNFVGIPADLADGDDDTLGDLSCSGDEIARWNGSAWNCSSDDDTPYARTYVVSPVGTTTQNGTALRNAIAAITPPASQDEAVLLKLEPGVYDVGTTGIEIWGWMTLEGAGRDLTKITGEVCGANSSSGSAVLVIGSDYSGLRRISVRNTCASSMEYSYGVFIYGPSATIEDAYIESWGEALSNTALNVRNGAYGLRAENVEVMAARAEDNIGVVCIGSAVFEGLTARATQGTDATAFVAQSNGITIRSSALNAWASGAAIALEASSSDNLLLEDVVAESVSTGGSSQGMILSYVTGLLVNVRAVGNTGIEMDSSATITMQGAFVEGSVTGIHCSVDTLDITHSRIDGGTNAIVRTGGTVTLDGVVMRGGPVSGTVTCTGCMRNGTFSASGCP